MVKKNKTIVIGFDRKNETQAEELILALVKLSGLQILLGFNKDYYPDSAFFDQISNEMYPAICIDNKPHQCSSSAILYPPKDSYLGFDMETMKFIPVKGQNLDSFFTTLAEALSGTIFCLLLNRSNEGQDGLRFMRSCGALTYSLVSSKNFRSDFVLPPNELANALKIRLNEVDSLETKEHLNDIVEELSRFSGINFSCYKEETMKRRIQKRMMVASCFSFDDYLAFLKSSEDEISKLLNESLIGVTYFFRDSEIFHDIGEIILPDICKEKTEEEEIRIWTAGCASGEEAYSMAILMEEINEKLDHTYQYKIFATDIDKDSLETGKEGIYTEETLMSLKSEFRQKYFTSESDGRFKIRDSIRKHIIFSYHNLINDPPYLNIDLISCRNMLIYIKQECQKRIFDNFRFSVKTKGYLVLGKSELLSKYRDDFKIVSSKRKIYQCISKRKVYPQSLGMHFYPQNKKKGVFRKSVEDEGTTDKKEKLFQKILLREFAPPCVIIDNHYQLVYTEGDVSNILRFSSGSFRTDIFKLIDARIAAIIRAGIIAAKKDKTGIVLKNISTEHKGLSLSFEELDLQEEGIFYKLVFISEEGTPKKGNIYKVLPGNEIERYQMESLQDELQITRQELKETVEALESSNEELQSSNEELLASNEELQSANESLYTLNNQLNDNNQELAEINTEQKNLLNNSQIGIIFLDMKLRIRKFTPAAQNYFKLINSDKGRELEAFASCFPEKTKKMIIDSAKKVLQSGSTIEKEIIDEKGNIFFLRELPFLLPNDKLGGVILTFDNISYIKKIESKLNEKETEIKLVFDSMDSAFAHHEIILDSSGTPCDYRFLNINPAFEKMLGKSRDAIVGKTVLELLPDVEQYWIEKYGELAINGQSFDYTNYSQDLDRYYRVHAYSPAKMQFAVFIYDVTREVRMEEMEREQERKMQFSLEAGGICTWEEIVNEGKMLFSDQWYRLIDEEKKEFPESLSQWIDRLHPDDRESFMERKSRYLSGDISSMEINIRYQSREGIIWLLCRGKVMEWDENKKPVRLFGTFTDVSRQVELQNREKESYRKYKLAVKSSGLSLLEYDVNADLFHFDSHIADFWGEQIFNEHINLEWVTTRISESYRKSAIQQFEAIKAGRQNNLSIDIPFECSDRKTRWINAVIEVIEEDKQHKPTRIIGFIRDISERVEQETRIRQENEFLETTQREARIGFWSYDHEKRLFFLGKGVRMLFKQNIPECIKREEIESLSLPEAVNSIFKSIDEMLTNNGDTRHFELVFPQKNGDRLYYNGEYKLIRDSLDAPVMVNGWIQDNSHLFELESKLNQKAKMASIGQLAGGIAHDFNNQLMGIMGYASLLQEKGCDNQSRRFIDQIMKAAQHSADLTQKLLLFSRKGKYMTETVDFHEIIDNALDIIKPGLDAGFRIDIRKKAKLSVLSCDPSLIQSSIINMAVNAKEAMPDGGKLVISTENVVLKEKKGQIKPEIEGLINSSIIPYPGKFIKLDIIDYGAGIPKGVREQLFEPFYTTKIDGMGAGMGLPAVYGTVEAHAGFISFKTEEGKGTIFSLYFPILDEKIEQDQFRDEPKGNEADPRRILLIDDEPIPLDVTNEMLLSLGYETRCFLSGKEAVDHIINGEADYHLVLVDMTMPEYNGSYVFHEIRKIIPDQKIMILSGYTETDEIKDLLKKGAAGFIHKPITLVDLEKSIGLHFQS